MTTKRQAPPVLDLTLTELCQQIDAHLGRETGVEAAVTAYRRFSDEASALDNKGKYMTALVEGISAHLDAAKTPPMIGRARIERIPAKTYKTHRLTSESVKKTDYGLWVASAVEEVRLAVKTDIELVAPPVGTRFFSTQAAWRAWEAAKERRRFCEQRRDAARDTLRAVFAEAAETWGGEALLTSDGWRLGWSSGQRFSASRCAEIAAQRGIDLDPMKVVSTSTRSATFKLIEPDEFDEVDEIDGD
ncbi:hypothetical protein SEA_DONNY_67 [Mycobacterium phage Donny]|uniref:Uncharacterized protein n=2 Tax=Acadianvirus acadian TaxID=1982901 RepID=A0A481VRK6_9CAUD|nr:hypothetical protein CM14_gp66 [Mycobacterium phage Acadian]AER48979.1 hypothetical protein ACADIAN_66 [Mycobacterium phage Acadian]QBI96425.1 hypothetical protein SEA_DONNY_67 [Mycobacterium phage Donny]WUT94836.1 hypothetical protein PRODRIGUEZ_66 [Mycobacterium phage PRodriguez]